MVKSREKPIAANVGDMVAEAMAAAGMMLCDPACRISCETDGVFLGLAKYMAPTVFGNQVKGGNLGELALARSEQKARANVVAGARLMRETERRADNARVLAQAAAAPSRAAQSQFEDLAGEGPVELGDL